MTKSAIIDFLIADKKFNKTMKQIFNKSRGDFDDFKSHIFLILLEMEEDKILDIYNKGKIYAYTAIMMRIQAYYKTSTFHRQYRKQIEYIPETDIIDNSKDKMLYYTHICIENIKKQDIEKEGELLGVYNYILFNKYYKENKTYQKIQEETGIHYLSVRTSVMKTKKRIQEMIKKYEHLIFEN